MSDQRRFKSGELIALVAHELDGGAWLTVRAITDRLHAKGAFPNGTFLIPEDARRCVLSALQRGRYFTRRAYQGPRSPRCGSRVLVYEYAVRQDR